MRGITSRAAPSDVVPRHDDSYWALFTIEMPPQRMSPAAFDAHLVARSSLFERGEPFLLLIDMGDHPSLLASQRSALVEAMRVDGERHPGLCRGLAVVVRSSFERSVVQSIHSLANQKYPVAACASVAEARAWLAQMNPQNSAPPSRMSRERVPPPSRVGQELLPPSSRRSLSAAPPVSLRMRQAAAPSSRRPRESVLPFSRRPRELAGAAPAELQRSVTRRPSSEET